MVKNIKEKICYVCADPRKEEKAWSSTSAGSEQKVVDYLLPDGRTIKVTIPCQANLDNILTLRQIGPEQFRAPEILFNPDMIGTEYPGVHQMIIESINRVDLELRKTLYGSIHLSGGTTLTRGFSARLLNALQKESKNDVRIKMYAPSNRMYSTWIGGSILAGLSTFKKVSYQGARDVFWKRD